MHGDRTEMTEAHVGGAGAWRAWVALAAITLVAAGLRVGGMFTEFWLDEIWSWLLAWDAERSPVRSALDVFTRLYHDNNHWLNTIWIRWMGEQPWWGYRLLSLVTGCALVPVTGLIGKRDGRGVGIVAAALTGACYLL